MTSEEARLSLSFHSGRNGDIHDPRWINGFLGSLRKFNKEIIEENFIDVMNCLRVLSTEFTSDVVDKSFLADVYGILYYTTLWIQDGGLLSDIDKEIKDKIKYWMEMYSYAVVLLLDYSEEGQREAFLEFDEYLKNPYDKYTKRIMDDVNEITNGIFDDIKHLDQYPDFVSKQVLKILVRSACLGQNCAPIELGRKKIGEIANREWLIQHFMEVADESIDYSDEWEYRRLMELVSLHIPELKEEIIARGISSTDEEIKEVIEDFNTEISETGNAVN